MDPAHPPRPQKFPSHEGDPTDAGDPPRVYQLGCVSYINAKPLIEGVDEHPRAHVVFDVPAQLLAGLERGDTDLALCPVIDYYRAAVPLTVYPVGGIGCEGPTLTVRLYSRSPIDRIQAVHADTDSHTSVALLQVLLNAKLGRVPTIIDYNAREGVAGGRLAARPEAMLLIGDKVVTGSPLAVEYPHQLDLGGAWNELTGLPFLFAVWMGRADADLGDLPKLLDTQRQRNAKHLRAIAQRYAPAHGWPEALAEEYFADILRYRVGPRELTAMEKFGAMAAELGLVPGDRSGAPLQVWRA